MKMILPFCGILFMGVICSLIVVIAPTVSESEAKVPIRNQLMFSMDLLVSKAGSGFILMIEVEESSKAFDESYVFTENIPVSLEIGGLLISWT